MSHIGQTIQRVTGSGSLHGRDWATVIPAAIAAALGGYSLLGPAAAAGTSGMAAGEGLGMLGAADLAGLGGTGAAAGSGYLGGLIPASDFTAAMAGDAYMPGALGASGEGSASLGSLFGGQLQGVFSDPAKTKMLMRGMQAAQYMTQQPSPSPMAQRPPSGGNYPNTVIPTLGMPGTSPTPGVPGVGGLNLDDPQTRALFEKWKQQQIGVFS